MSVTRVAYWAAMWLWVPLAVIAMRAPNTSRRLAVPIAFSALAAAYEMYMTFVWEPTVTAPIRIDILLVLQLTGIVDAIAAIVLAATARGHPRRGALLAAAACCAAVPALGVASLVEMQRETKASREAIYSGNRLHFEAALRDDATQRRVFGELRPNANPLAGYYRDGERDDRFAHFVLADDGRFWLYTKDFFETTGTGSRPAAGGPFEGRGDPWGVNERMRLTFAPAEGDSARLTVDYGYSNAQPVTAPMRRTAPPRFPVPPARAGDEVIFDGVYSATYDERESGFWLTQVWLWHSGDQWWGEYIRDRYTRGYRKDFISTGRVEAKCRQPCAALEFKTGRGMAKLSRKGPDTWTARMDGVRDSIPLRRGETLPGFLYDLAPTATRKEHDAWMAAVKYGHMLRWTPPVTSPRPAS